MTVLRTLLEVTIYSSILFLVILLFRAIFKKHASPAMLYAAWLLLVVRLLVPVTVGGISIIVLPAQEAAAQAPQRGVSEPIEHTDGRASTSPRITAASAEEPAAAEPAAVQANARPEDTEITVNRDIPWEWDWNTALITLWIAGAAVVLLNMAAAKATLHKRLASAPRLPDERHETALRIQNELGIRSRVRFAVMRGFDSPVISASLRPTIVIPMELLWQNGQSVEFALRHELTHLKRKDHLVCLLLTLLKAIYWFNPAVWLAVRLMRMDMETACDSRVVSAMDGTVKKQYASTVLNMYAEAKPHFVLGMALGSARQTAERRIRGIFMRQRSARGVKAAALLLAAVMLVACFTTALQPVRAASPENIEIESPVRSLEEITPSPESPAPKPIPTPAPMPAYTPEPTANPDLSALRQKSQLASANITADMFTFAIRKDGTVVQAGQNPDYGTFDISKWRNITAISSGNRLLIGLRSNGRVVVTGNVYLAMGDSISRWRNITSVEACVNVLMGLKSDGTVEEIGITYDSTDPDKVKNWKDIVAIAAGNNFGVGLRSDGTVVATGNNDFGQCEVDDWKDIVAIAAGERDVVGLRSDGTVVAAGYSNGGQRSVQSWCDIIAIGYGGYGAVGLKADGTVVTEAGPGNTNGWKDIIAISAGLDHIVGLRADGTMVASGGNQDGQCEVKDWTDIATERLK